MYFVALTPLRNAPSIITAIAQAIGFTFSGGGLPKEQLLNYLKNKHLLLILDNYEHLLSLPMNQGGEKIVVDILTAAPNTKILVTSRIHLNIPGENLVRIGGMCVPSDSDGPDGSRFGAVQLFLQSARRGFPGYAPTANELVHIGQICRLVQGLPLGILLAASWMPVLSPSEIAQELATEQEVSLDFLETDWREIPKRHRSIRAVFEYSWDQLDREERQILEAFSIFRGGGTRDAIQQVTGASLRNLRKLVNCSLIERSSAGRYEMHELLRQYAAEKLVKTPDAGNTVRDKHARFYIHALNHWAGASKGPDQLEVLSGVDSDLDNIRAAWDWAISKRDVTWLISGLDGYCSYLQWRGYFGEGETVCQKTVECLLDSTSDAVSEKNSSAQKLQGMRGLVMGWAWYGYYAYTQGKISLANNRFQQGMNIIEKYPDFSDELCAEHAFLLRSMAEPALDTNLAYAQQLAQQSLSLYRITDDPWGQARALYILAHTAWRYGHIDKSTRLNAQGLDIFRRLGDHREIAFGLMSCAMLDTNLGKPEKAEKNIREGFAIAQEIGDANLIGMSHIVLCCTLRDQGRFTEARQHREHNLIYQRERGNTTCRYGLYGVFRKVDYSFG